jgi:hypothetical protein
MKKIITSHLTTDGGSKIKQQIGNLFILWKTKFQKSPQELEIVGKEGDAR